MDEKTKKTTTEAFENFVIKVLAMMTVMIVLIGAAGSWALVERYGRLMAEGERDSARHASEVCRIQSIAQRSMMGSPVSGVSKIEKVEIDGIKITWAGSPLKDALRPELVSRQNSRLP